MTRLQAVATAASGPGARAGSEARTDAISDLVRIRAALAVGLSPVEALSAASTGVLVDIAAAARLGQPLSRLADQHPEVGPGLQLLLRVLALAQLAGSGGAAGAEQAMAAIRETRRTERLLRVKTAQARGSATLMAVVPVMAWVLLVAFDGTTLRFYTTAPGMLSGGAAAMGMYAGRRWSRSLVDRAVAAAGATDPLQPPGRPADVRRGVAVAAPVALLLLVWLGPVAGVVVGAAAGAIAARPARGRAMDLHEGGTPEVTELLALALETGMPVVSGVGLVAEVGPVAAREAMSAAQRRLEAGWRPGAAFDRTRLETIGELLEAADRWGAPVAPTLRGYAEELREARRLAAEEAAERTQLALVFPTTLLTLPAFALAIVPPLVWTGFAS